MVFFSLAIIPKESIRLIMRCLLGFVVLFIQKEICQNSTEETVVQWNQTNIKEESFELTTSLILHFDTTEKPMLDIRISEPVKRVLNQIVRTYKPYCRRQSYGRGIGRPLHTCPDHASEQDGLLCYPSCRAGYNGVGPVCWEKCENTTSMAFLCVDVRLSERSCPWYDKCGIVRRSCVSCPESYMKLGCFCGRVYLRDSYGRGVGSPLTCSESYEQDGALCYNKCTAQYNGVGPVCWQHCPSTHPHSCLTGCSITKEACQNRVIDMVESVVKSALSILNLLIGIPFLISKTADILSNAANREWLLVAKDLAILAVELADKILQDVAKRFYRWSSGTIESATKNASLILTVTALKDNPILLPFLKMFHFDSLEQAFNHKTCELPSEDDNLDFLE